MTKILIPTDFSVPAENAARFALSLAKELKTDVLLCNAFKVPSEAPMASQVAWPLMNYVDLKQDATTELDSLVKSLDSSCSETEDDYCPDLAYESGVGSVCEVVAELVEKEEVVMVVMGTAGAGSLTQWVLGSNSLEMIDKANVPLLLVPTEAAFKGIKRIAFATDLSTEDMISIQFVIKLAEMLNASLTIVHVTNKAVDPKGKLQNTIDAIGALINSVTVKYEYVWNMDVNSGLDWIVEEGDLDLMAMSHHRHNLLSKIFKGSHAKKLSRRIKIPLLVFSPEYKIR